MSLPTSPTSVTKTIPSYLYFQYQDDQDLPSLIDAYNTMTQEYVDWFNSINLPVYSGLSGALLDWVGQGIYGIFRPTIGSETSSFSGQIASYTIDDLPISDIKKTSTSNTFETPDDIYQRLLTWWFFKADGFAFSIPWLKRRIYRFLYGINGTNPNPTFTPQISVVFTETTPIPTCAITLTNTPLNMSQYFNAAVSQNLFGLPFRFQYTVTIYEHQNIATLNGNLMKTISGNYLITEQN